MSTWWARRLLAPRLHGLVVGLGALALLVLDPVTAVAGPEGKRVVVIYPHESDGAPGIIQVNRAIRSTFANQPPGQIEVRNEYVDATRLRDADFMQAQVALLRRKYAGRKPDLVIAGLSSGLDFALAIRDEVFPGAPIVFVLVEQRELKARRLPPDVTGVPLRMNLTGTLDLALRLHPATRRVFVIAGSSSFDTKWEAEARRVFRPYEDRVEFVYLSGLPMDDLLARVGDLPEQSVIYYLHVFTDRTGKGFVPAEVLERLADRANAPIYSHVDTFIDRGAIGGSVYSHETEGEIAARLGLRILSGERPETISVPEVSESTYLFNWRQLRRWEVSEKSLPPGSVVRHKEPTFWGLYKWRVGGVAALCFVQAVLIAGMLVQRGKRRRADRSLRESEARFRLMADAAPVLIWAAGVDQRCTYCNQPWLEFTGRPLDRELGDGWAEGVHPDDRARCLAVIATHFDTRAPFELVYRLRRHDGEYRWILDRGVPRFTADGEFAGYLGACTDITDRRRAEDELRASRQELQLLTRRLLEAQEAERRRIARELHDDVNQSLALLAVELELMVGSPAEVADRGRELSGRLKEISSSVHDLSHRLHPSKLEHLGLVAAVNGLCKELRQSHALDVKFTHYPDPGPLPPDVALCLYRIVQEALRNVVRHSGSHHASVELTGTGDAVRLRVADDGRGFDPGAVGVGLGLVSMRERLNLVGGELRIDSRPSGGTRIDVCVPLPAIQETVNDLLPTASGEDAPAVATASTEKMP